MRTQTGFTLIELLVTIAVAAILLTVAVPSFRSLTQNNRMSTQANELTSALSLSRSEAIKRGQRITVCASTNGATCNTNNWENGWIVFSDTNGNQTVDAVDTLLRVTGALETGKTLRSSGFSNAGFIQYASSGLALAQNPDEGTFTLCDDRGATSARGVIVGATGRIKASDDSNSDGTREDIDGNNLTCP